VTITLRIQRYNPETDAAPHFRDYELDVALTDRVLDALIQVQTRLDGTLALRKSCAHGICGSDAMVINGSERLACKTFIRDVARGAGDVVTIEPLRGMPVQRDLCVDQSAFFGKFRAVKPYLIASQPPAEKEFVQSQQERARFEDQTKCILCSACYSSCPVVRETRPAFIGPAAVVQASRFAFDSRDDGLDERRETLDHPDGVWACEGHFNCTRVCPRGIKVTKAITLLKRHLKTTPEPDH
jgi:succinate dehydrogenase / fumarate reductase iron-sulfur subunit